MTRSPLFDVREPAADAALGTLPEWDLTDLYSAPDAPEIARDLDWLRKECAAFAADYEGRLAALDGAGLLEAIRRYERIDAISGRIGSYAGLRYYQATTDPVRAKFMGDMQTALTDASTPLVFFTLELNRLDDAALDATVASNAELLRYQPVLDRIRKMKPHQLSDELEKFLHDQSVVGTAAWNRLFDETMAGLTFEIGGETAAARGHPRPPLRHRPRPPPGGRRGARRRLRAATSRSSRASPTRSPRRRRSRTAGASCRRPQAGRHLANDVEPEVVQALRDAVVAAYPRLSHRYYALKAKWLGLDKLQVWDRNAPLPKDDDRKIPWTEARADRPRRLRRLRPPHGGARRPLLRPRLDRRRRQARQGARRLRPPDGDRRPPLRAPQLPRQAARRDDPRPRARPRRPPAPRRRPGRASVLDAPHPRRDRERLRRDADLPPAPRRRARTRRRARSSSPRRPRT